MKILMIEPVGYSGMSIYSLQLCGALKRAGCAITLATGRRFDVAHNPTTFVVHAFLGGGDRTHSRIRRAIDYIVSWRMLPRLLLRERPDVVHFQNAFVPIVDLLVVAGLRLCGVPVVYTVHDVNRAAMMTRHSWRLSLSRIVDRAVYCVANRLIVHATQSQDELERDYAISARKIHRIRHGNQSYHVEGVEIPSKSAARRRLGLRQETFTVLFFGDRRPSKGLDLLIRAFAQACTSGADLSLVIAGEQRVLDKTDYHRLINEAGIQSKVLFIDGFVPKEEVAVLFAACDVVALPYRRISHSGVVHLAFAFGKAVVASRAGGLAESVDDGKTGFVVDDPEDVKSLAHALLRAKRNRAMLDLMGAEAKKLENDRYGWDAIGSETLRTYDTVVHSKNGRAMARVLY